MRTILLISAAAVLAACSDNQQPTAPRSMSSRGSAAGQVAPSTQGIKLPDAKPVDQVGFTKVTESVGGSAYINAWGSTTAWANCPAGTTVVGGGYEVSPANPGWAPIVTVSHRAGSGWVIEAVYPFDFGQPVQITAIAYCLS